MAPLPFSSATAATAEGQALPGKYNACEHSWLPKLEIWPGKLLGCYRNKVGAVEETK